MECAEKNGSAAVFKAFDVCGLRILQYFLQGAVYAKYTPCSQDASILWKHMMYSM